jgi:hypothetical protein
MISRLLFLAGCACLTVVVLTHIAERFGILPGMGWGLPDSPGHYLDLTSAISGAVLLLAAGIVRLLQSH